MWHLNPFCGERRGEGRERKDKERKDKERKKEGGRSGRKGGLERRRSERWDSWEFRIKSPKLFDICGSKGYFLYVHAYVSTYLVIHPSGVYK